ncbi:hypothetical protein ACX6XY_17115 [Streptomyces sp. O3]
MGSLRNPIGPLPSSIYWRRRAVLLSAAVVLLLLVVWLVSSLGGEGRTGASGANDKGGGPTPSITPGPSGSGTPIDERPGGRDESSDAPGEGGNGSGGDDGDGDGDGSGSDGGSGGDGSGSGGDDAKGSGGASAGGSSGSGAGGSAGERVPAGSTLANCTASGVKLTLRSAEKEYRPGEKPELELIVESTSGEDCKIDLGPKRVVLTITPVEADDPLWASDDCPSGAGSLLLRVPGEQRITHTVKWDRAASAPECATPRPGSAKPGRYLAEAKAPGFPKAFASFELVES